jgi:hypothetical protein
MFEILVFSSARTVKKNKLFKALNGHLFVFKPSGFLCFKKQQRMENAVNFLGLL